MTHVHQDLGAFVIGALDADEAERVRAHLDGCAACAGEHAQLLGIPALLDLAVMAGATDADPLPPALEERLLDRFARERPRQRPVRRRRRLVLLGGGGALAGAVAATAVLLGVLGFERSSRPTGEVYRLAFAPAAGTPAAATARASLRSVEGGTVLRLWVAHLPGRPGDVYEVLCESKDWHASAGTFRVDAQGKAYVILTTAAEHGQYDSVRIVRRSHGQAADVFDGRLS